MQRMGLCIGVEPEHIARYRELHAAVWPQVLETISRANIRNYSIFLREPENLLFAYWEYHGADFAADSEGMLSDPAMVDWWKVCTPLQTPFESRAEGEWWASMVEVFHQD